jgi:hypothetical protein
VRDSSQNEDILAGGKELEKNSGDCFAACVCFLGVCFRSNQKNWQKHSQTPSSQARAA